MKRVIAVMGLMVVMVTVLTSQAKAQTSRMRYGKLILSPGLTVQETYDDNIYLGNGKNTTAERKESDLITHITPAAGLTYTLPERGRLDLAYNGDLAFYGDNDDNNWQTHKGAVGLDYRAPGGLLFGVNNIYTDAEDPYGSLEQYRIGLKTERWNNDLKTKIGYDFGNRLMILGSFNYYKQDYDLERDYAQDYDESEFGIGCQMRVLPKTWGFARVHLGERDYFTHPPGTGVIGANDSDLTWRRFNVGLTWDTGAKLSGELNLGYQWQEHDNRIDVYGNAYEDRNTWIAATSVTNSVTPATALALLVTRAVRQTGSDTNEYFEDTGIGVSLLKKILTKYAFTASIAYNVNDYNAPVSKPRKDDNYNAALGLEYKIRDWLSAAAGYRYKIKDSNYYENDYTDNQFLISVRGVY
jgi:hypothetical protein